MLFSKEEEKEAQFGVKPVGKKVESAGIIRTWDNSGGGVRKGQVFIFLVYSDRFVSHLFL